MCRAATSLVYGVPVRTSSLLFAVIAWPRLKRPFRFLDLISLRRRRDTFVTRTAEGTPSAVERVPSEVWDLIRHKLVDLELDKADAELFLELVKTPPRGEYCWRDIADSFEAAGGGSVYWSALLQGMRGELPWTTTRRKRARSLLSPLGLRLPPTALLYLIEDPEDLVDPYSAIFLVLKNPSLPDYRTSTLKATSGLDWAADEHGLADVSFEVPSDARQRFVSLIKLLHLEPLEIENAPPPSLPADNHNGEDSDVDETNAPFKFSQLDLADVVPRFRLHVTCTNGW
ncbi:hypothetical protein JCM10213_009276 [Rhodosporidiobolus nylandii]